MRQLFEDRRISISREKQTTESSEISDSFHSIPCRAKANLTYLTSAYGTITDLEGTPIVLDHHIMEAIAYRKIDRPNYLGTNL
jgi:predicted ATPase with chaperone activity